MPEQMQKKSVIYYLQSIEPRMKAKGFRRAMFDALRKEDSAFGYEQDELDELWEADRFNVRAHAYLIDSENRVVYLFHVEGTSSMTDYMREEILDTYWFLEYMQWDLRLFLIDQYGGNWRAIPLFTLDILSRAEEVPGHEEDAVGNVDWDKTYHRALGQSWLFPLPRVHVVECEE